MVDRYPFEIYVGKGAQDHRLEALKIDYNVSGDPLRLRFVLDKLVQTEPGHCLGKLNIRTIPGLTFVLDYFHREK